MPRDEDSDDRERPKLKSLAQAAHGNQLKQIRGTQTGRRGGNFAIHLLHTHGYCTIPPSVQADSEELLAFLETQPLGTREIPKVAPVLRDFLKQQMAVLTIADIYHWPLSHALEQIEKHWRRPA